MEVEDLILPQQNKTIVAGAIPISDMDEENEEPCNVLDTEEDEHECPICTHSSSERGVISKMNELEERLTGHISPEEIYRILHQLWTHEIVVPLQRQGVTFPELTIDDIRKHYTSHRMNMRQVVSKEILFVSEMQRQLKRNQIAVRNRVTGQKKLVMKGISEWQKLSKHKLELIKYYHNTLMKNSKKGGGGSGNVIQPYSFD